MKYLRILTSITFFLAICISGYGQGQCPHIDDEGEIVWGPCPPDPSYTTGDVATTESDADNGGGSTSGPTGPGGGVIYCKTNYTIVSETTFPCGSGFGVEIVWQMSCSSGNEGTCQEGTFIEYAGCHDGELPAETVVNVSTVTCR